MLYRIGPDWSPTLEQVEAALDAHRFVECSASQDKSVGWASPRGEEHGALVESIGGQWMLQFVIERKVVPGFVVRRHVEQQAQAIEQTTGRKPGKKELRTLRDDAVLALLPQAFAQQARVRVWIDPGQRWLVTDAGSQAKADEVVTGLVRALDRLAITPLQTAQSPQAAMAQWLSAKSTDDWPAAFAIERECELKASGDEPAVVRFARHPLFNDEVRQHIAEGKLPTRLALSWEGRVSFVLTQNLQLKKIRFLEGVFEGGEDEDSFDASVALLTGELGRLLPDLVEALGGEWSHPAGGPAGPGA